MLNRLEIKSAERIKRGNKISEETLEARIGSLRSCFQEFNCKNINLDRYSAPKKNSTNEPRGPHSFFAARRGSRGSRSLGDFRVYCWNPFSCGEVIFDSRADSISPLYHNFNYNARPTHLSGKNESIPYFHLGLFQPLNSSIRYWSTGVKAIRELFPSEQAAPSLPPACPQPAPCPALMSSQLQNAEENRRCHMQRKMLLGDAIIL